MYKLKEKPSALKGEHPALPRDKIRNCLYFPSHLCPPGSEPNTDPDLQHWSEGRVHKGIFSIILYYQRDRFLDRVILPMIIQTDR
jgi:hypothetical protein